MTDAASKKRFDNIDAQLERISTYLVKGFDCIDKTLETKADAVDVQKALNILDSFAKR